jgi:hypothetical protein
VDGGADFAMRRARVTEMKDGGSRHPTSRFYRRTIDCAWGGTTRRLHPAISEPQCTTTGQCR